MVLVRNPSIVLRFPLVFEAGISKSTSTILRVACSDLTQSLLRSYRDYGEVGKITSGFKQFKVIFDPWSLSIPAGWSSEFLKPHSSQ